MSLSPSDVRRIKDAYNEAAKNYPHPDRPVMPMGTKVLSMNELANEVETETKIGRRIIEEIDALVASGETTVDAAIKQITRKPAKRW